VIGPCVFPGCRGEDGNPVLTALGICPDCQPKLHRLLTDVVLDYVNLKRNMPKPAPKSKAGRGSPSRAGYGHPAEWASDTAAEIKEALFWFADELADFLLTPPPVMLGGDEAAAVNACYRFLLNNFDFLARHGMAGHVSTELLELHQTVRQGMGHTRMGERLPAPCPSCDVAALIRRPPARARRGAPPLDPPPIRCANCGHEIELSRYDAVVSARVADVAATRAAAIDAALEAWQDGQGPPCAAHHGAPQRCRSTRHAGQDPAPDVAPAAAASQPRP
jgi:hypothetical protein